MRIGVDRNSWRLPERIIKLGGEWYAFTIIYSTAGNLSSKDVCEESSMLCVNLRPMIVSLFSFMQVYESSLELSSGYLMQFIFHIFTVI